MNKLLIYVFMIAMIFTSCKSEVADKKAPQKQKTDVTSKTKSKKSTKQINFSKLKSLKSGAVGKIEKVNGKETGPNMKYVLDKNNLVVQGWVINMNEKSVAKNVYVKVGNKNFKAETGKKRPGVAKKYKSEKYLNSGFVARIPIKNIPKGQHPLSIRVLSNDSKSYYSIKSKKDVTVVKK